MHLPTGFSTLRSLLKSVIGPPPGRLGLGIERDRARTGGRFFFTGRAIVETLAKLACHVRSKNLEGIEEIYNLSYRGQLLGLTRLEFTNEKDGIETRRFKSESAGANRAEAVREWGAYLNSFEDIKEAGIHLHRLEKWRSRSNIVAIVRFELIGTPLGASRAGIDRALFRMKFEARHGGPTIREAALVEGERVISAKAHFVDVAEPAGIAFTNHYYPEFLNQPLPFGMIRYGPAGITAVDRCRSRVEA